MVDKKTKLVKGASVDRERRRQWRRQTSTLASFHHFILIIIIVRYLERESQGPTNVYLYTLSFLYEEVVKDLFSSVMMNLYFSSVIIYICTGRYKASILSPRILSFKILFFILLLFVAYFVVDYYSSSGWILASILGIPFYIHFEVHSRAPPSDRFQGQNLTLCYSEIFFFRPEFPFRFLLLKRERESF